MCGYNDMRDVLARRDAGDERAALAFDVYCTRIKATVGAYLALLGRVDAITFTAGVGENAAPVRAASLAGLEGLGIAVDPERNSAPVNGERVISPDGAERTPGGAERTPSGPERTPGGYLARVAVWVVPTDEELEIATQTLAALAAS
jgi:acetate kinase